MTDTVMSIERRLGDSAKFYSVNVAENPKTCELAGVLVVPTLVIYKSGRAVERLFGVQDEDFLTGVIEEAIVG